MRLASTGDGPFQWVVGGFYSERRSRLCAAAADPGLRRLRQSVPRDASDDPSPATRRTSSRRFRHVANGFPLDSPYNADLPYDIKQKAVFGEASYDFGQFKLTARRLAITTSRKSATSSPAASSPTATTRSTTRRSRTASSPRVIGT